SHAFRASHRSRCGSARNLRPTHITDLDQLQRPQLLEVLEQVRAAAFRIHVEFVEQRGVEIPDAARLLDEFPDARADGVQAVVHAVLEVEDDGLTGEPGGHLPQAGAHDGLGSDPAVRLHGHEVFHRHPRPARSASAVASYLRRAARASEHLRKPPAVPSTRVTVRLLLSRVTAIVGAFHRDGMAVSHAVAERMMGALSHHGPDGSGSWREGPVLMGLQRLAVAEGQPLAPTEQRHARGPVVVVADVRLDNREELAVALDRPVGSSDEELLLHAWLRWGEACPGRLLGDFAFAVWDGRDGRLFCARDPIGVRALHYHLATGVFLFATEIKALRAHGAVSDELDEGRIADHLGRIFADRTRTFFRDVRRLPPGHAMCVTAEAARRWCYWSLDPALRTELSDDDEYAERFLELL